MKMVIAVGSNLENPELQVEHALDRLSILFDLVAASPIYRTQPLGVTDQPEFRNAVAIIEDERTPKDVLHVLHEIEADAGRERSIRWGPRTLDLDLIVAGDIRSDDPDCLLPHPRAHERAFVLVPWNDIDPDAVLPGYGSVRELIKGAMGEVEL